MLPLCAASHPECTCGAGGQAHVTGTGSACILRHIALLLGNCHVGQTLCSCVTSSNTNL